MTFTRLFFPASKAISKGIRTGYRSAVAVCVAGLLVTVPPTPLLASAPTPIGLDLSFQIGPFATKLNITQPVARSATTPTGGSVVVFHSTLHLHVKDDTQTPAFNADVVAAGEAADPDTLVGGFLPATIRMMQDLQAGMTFQQAVADVQAKTEIMMTFFQDPGLVEYALVVFLVAFASVAALQGVVAPTFGGQLSAIQTKMAAALIAIGITPPCSTSGTTIP